MSVEKAQRLVNHDLIKNTSKLLAVNESVNFLCLVAGRLNYAEFVPSFIFPVFLSLPAIGFFSLLGALIVATLFHNKSLILLALLPVIFLGDFIEMIIRWWHFIPISLFSYLGPLWCGRNPGGWLTSVGLLGFKSWDGSFSSLTTLFGFTGLKLFTLDNEETFFIGTALYLKIVPYK